MESGAAGHAGNVGPGVACAIATIAAAWNVQGDAARAPFAAAFQRAFGISAPVAPNTTARTGALTVLWLGPRSWLLVSVGASSLVDFAVQRDAIRAARGALFDVSAARVAWTIAGPRAADVLSKGCPLDFHPRAFAAGSCAQTLYGHIGVLVERHAGSPAFTMYVGRSYANDVWHALARASAQYGETLGPMPLR